MLKRFAFRAKMLYLCTSEEEKVLNMGLSPLFLRKMGQKNHCFTKHIEKFICRREISTGFCGNFSGQVGARIDDAETRKVKRYLFSTLHFFHFGKLLRSFQNTSQCTARCFRLVSDMKDKNQDKPLEESGGFALVFGFRVGLIRASS